MTYKDGQRKVWKVIQEGSGANDYVLNLASDVLARADPYMYAAMAATDFIRVRAWEGNPTVRFMVFGSDEFASGPCEVVR